jgi:crotonobetainyl-CoA:carnitine CoA-transferase CaiB-like acyl-CoA transferase
MLVADFCRYLPGAYASRELLRLGARVVRVERPGGDPMREAAPAWDAALGAGKETVTCDLPADARFARALCRRADVVLDSFRPGVLEALGVEPTAESPRVVWCSLTGFGIVGAHAGRAGHDVNYLGWAGVLEDSAPTLPPVQIADLAAGALGAVTQILAALLEREHTGRGTRIVTSMTHRSHDLIAHRLGGEPLPRLLTGGLACYRIYECSDGRWLTVGALEAKFFGRLCELIDRPELTSRQYGADQEGLAAELASTFAQRSLASWLELFESEDVCIGPVLTRAEAAVELQGGSPEGGYSPPGAHTEFWRAELLRRGLLADQTEGGGQ